jgi:hypothetical protein
MIALEIQNKGIQGSYYSNQFYQQPKPLDDGIVYAFGNNVIPDVPWPKVTYGMQIISCS